FSLIKLSVRPKIVSSSEEYGEVTHDGALLERRQDCGRPAACDGRQHLKRLQEGDAKCTYGTGVFRPFCTGSDIVQNKHGLLSTVNYQNGPGAKPVYALEGSIAVAGSTIKWHVGLRLRDSMDMVKTTEEVSTLAASVSDTGGIYFVTALSGLLAPYWDPGAAGLIIGLTSYTTPAHLARATLEANAFQTREILESMKLDSKQELKNLKVDGGMTNGDMVMEILADVGGFTVVRPEMRESTALGSAILAGSAVGLFGWDIGKPESLAEVNTKGTRDFTPSMLHEEREKRWNGWRRAVERSRGWDEGIDES
ncbi:actin-like ATPase domain-containing protein, partial [Obba rivulosa]